MLNLEEFFPFPLDDFQIEAIKAINSGNSLVLTAPTGSGKTLIGEFAIHRGLSHGSKVFYTTPLKALSNQKFRDFANQFGENSVGGITSSRCTNEETYLVQKLVRAAFGNNNVDTCARVCHSPTGYGLKTTLGESAGTQTFDSVEKSDVIIVMGANPTDAHPVFASRMKKRLREGAKLIVVDPRQIDLVKSPHVRSEHHLNLRPGTNVALLNAIAHVIVREKLEDRKFIEGRCYMDAFIKWKAFIEKEENSPELMDKKIGVPAERIVLAARLFANANNGAIYYGLGVTEHSQGSTAVMAIANLAMLTGNLGRELSLIHISEPTRPERMAFCGVWV